MSQRARTANVFAWDNQGGVSRHIAILLGMLRDAGYAASVRGIPIRGRGARHLAALRSRLPRRPTVDLNLFVESIVPGALSSARTNVLIPMQEWFAPVDFSLLPLLDLVVCHSQHATDIFSGHGVPVRCLGFTSDDRRSDTAPDRRGRILHVAGRSHYKGSTAVLAAWAKHPEWPDLTIVHREGLLPVVALKNVEQKIGQLDDRELQRLQNEAWLHLQPSEAEGFGHCLCEGLSTGGVVLTMDAPPMNELVRAERGVLVPWDHQAPMNAGQRFFPAASVLERVVDEVLRVGPGGYEPMMRAAREWYEANDRRVHADFVSLFRGL